MAPRKRVKRAPEINITFFQSEESEIDGAFSYEERRLKFVPFEKNASTYTFSPLASPAG
jgi:hypothetical protein